MSLISIIVSSTILTFFYLIIACTFFNKKINLKSISAILGVLGLIIIIPFIAQYFQNFIKLAINLVVISMFYRIIFKEDLFKSLLISFTTIGYLFISEIIFCLILLVFLGVDAKELNNSWMETLGSNLFIGVISFLLLRIRPMREFIGKMINGRKDPKYNELLIIIIFVLGIIANYNVTVLGFNFDYAKNLLLIAFFVLIIYYLFREKRYKDQLSSEYDQLFNYIQKYEEEINKKNITIHSFQNQVIAIKGYISKNSQKANKYIDSVLNEFKSDESDLLQDMENIPKGGLKGLLYFKLGDLRKEKIKVLTDINPNLKRSKLSKIDSELYKNIVKILGVLIDNAIESARISKEKQIVLEIYVENGILHIILSNTYNGELEIDKFDNIGYSTKGKGRGYGLTLVNQIIDKYDIISQQREVIKNYYVVHLTINLKNIPIVK